MRVTDQAGGIRHDLLGRLTDAAIRSAMRAVCSRGERPNDPAVHIAPAFRGRWHDASSRRISHDRLEYHRTYQHITGYTRISQDIGGCPGTYQYIRGQTLVKRKHPCSVAGYTQFTRPKPKLTQSMTVPTHTIRGYDMIATYLNTPGHKHRITRHVTVNAKLKVQSAKPLNSGGSTNTNIPT
jgi:hypothetical protein